MLEGLDPLDHEARHLRGLVCRGEAREPLGRIPAPTRHRSGAPPLPPATPRAARRSREAPTPGRPRAGRSPDPPRRPAQSAPPSARVVGSQGLLLRMGLERGNRERRALLAAVGPEAAQESGRAAPGPPPRRTLSQGPRGPARPRRGSGRWVSSTRARVVHGRGSSGCARQSSQAIRSAAITCPAARCAWASSHRDSRSPRRRTARSARPTARALGLPRRDPPDELGRPSAAKTRSTCARRRRPRPRASGTRRATPSRRPAGPGRAGSRPRARTP